MSEKKLLKYLVCKNPIKGNHVLQDVSFTVDKGSIFFPARLKWCWKNDSNQKFSPHY